MYKSSHLSWPTSSPLYKTVNVGLRFDLFLHKQLTRLHLSSAIFNMLDEETCPLRGAKTTEIWVWPLLGWTDEQTQHFTASRWMIRLHFPTIPFPVGILQHFQREDEKASLLLQPSGNTSGCLTGDIQSQVEVVAADLFLFVPPLQEKYLIRQTVIPKIFYGQKPDTNHLKWTNPRE